MAYDDSPSPLTTLVLKQATPLGLPQWFTGFCTTEPFVSRDAE
jgi:hypothetical protein